jgi:hypothetical protein
VNRVLDWAGVGALIFVLLKILLVASVPIHDPDTFFHLRLGDELDWPWQWLGVDHWSRAATADWVPTQPLAEVLQAGADHVGGLPLVAWWYGLTLVVFSVVIYAIARAHGSGVRNHGGGAGGFGEPLSPASDLGPDLPGGRRARLAAHYRRPAAPMVARRVLLGVCHGPRLLGGR